MHNLRFYAIGGGAGGFAAFLDFARNQKEGTVPRVGSVLSGFMPEGTLGLDPNLWAILLVVLSSLFICWVFTVRTQIDAFMRGCSVLAAFSIGTPDPITNRQHLPGATPETAETTETSPTPLSWFSFVTPAAAQTIAASGTAGQIYIVLNHLSKEPAPLPESIVTIEDRATRDRSALFTTDGFIVLVVQQAGTYVVEIDTPGFERIAFDLTVDQTTKALSVEAATTNVPSLFQGLTRPTEVAVRLPDDEGYKQIGRVQLLRKDFDGAIRSYQEALKLDPDDAQTRNYLGYALFRTGNTALAKATLEKAIAERPNYKMAHVNLAKVNCAMGNLGGARAALSSGGISPSATLVKSDGEFSRVCAGI